MEKYIDEVEITPEMINAGVKAYAENFMNLVGAEPMAAPTMIREVFLAMVSVSPCKSLVKK